MTALSKEEYLKKYLSAENASAPEQKQKKKKKKPVEGAPVKKILANVKIVDNTIALPEATGKFDEEPEEGDNYFLNFFFCNCVLTGRFVRFTCCG